jgi:fumarylacetoacetate (FAA) hydrolase family protein
VNANLDLKDCLPRDGARGTLVGRAWVPGEVPGPSVVLVRDGELLDITAAYPTVAALLETDDPAAAARAAKGSPAGALDAALANSAAGARDPGQAHLLAPVDLQAIKACGVTFVASMLERVIEEQAKGDPAGAEAVRATINQEIGGDLSRVVPGSEAAERLKGALIKRGLWSQYLEVGIGPYAEVFSKAQPMSAVGTGAEIGIHPESTWNNPEPEVVLVINPRGEIVGATLGNDVNLRDFEGRSALLLGRAKDNNASCAIGPFLRLFDESFGIDEVRRCEVALTVTGEDGYRLSDRSSMSAISRDILDLAGQTLSANHQYPDGVVLFTGTMFVPVDDRDTPGQGFTHKLGDVVTISAPELGSLVNRVNLTSDIAPWTFGSGELMRNLAARGLL